MKNHTDVLIFHTGICAGASQIATDGRRELDVLIATPSLRSGMEETMKKMKKNNGYKKSIIKRGIAVGLIAIMASITPMQDVRPMGADVAKAATVENSSQDKAPYIGEVRLAVDASPENAKLLLTLAGYEVIDQDLNQGAGAYWNDIGDQAVYMGIKRTNEKKKSIRDMKTMNILGNYSYTGLK